MSVLTLLGGGMENGFFSVIAVFSYNLYTQLYANNQLAVKRVRAKTFKYSLPKKNYTKYFFLI